MATPDILDFERLLAPIPGDNPAGIDLRDGASRPATYDDIKDLRSQARQRERTVEAEDEPRGLLDEWQKILGLAQEIIATQSKDLEIAALLIEALVRAHGFAGLRDGFRLANGLIDAFWDGLYPPEDEEGVVSKVAPLSGLNGVGGEGTLSQPIWKVPLTDGQTTRVLAAWQYQQATNIETITDLEKKEAQIARGDLTLDEFDRCVKETSPDFLRTLIGDIDQCVGQFRTLNESLGERCGNDAPPSSNIRELLETVRDMVRYFSREVLPPETQAEEETAALDAGPSGDGGGMGPAGVGGPIGSRDQAFRLLLDVAAFFQKTEPHSPISATLGEVVRRGRMSWHDLAGELIPDDAARREYFIRAGIKPPPEE